MHRAVQQNFFILSELFPRTDIPLSVTAPNWRRHFLMGLIDSAQVHWNFSNNPAITGAKPKFESKFGVVLSAVTPIFSVVVRATCAQTGFITFSIQGWRRRQHVCLGESLSSTNHQASQQVLQVRQACIQGCAEGRRQRFANPQYFSPHKTSERSSGVFCRKNI